MNDRNDRQLETLLREHFEAKLDRELGKSAERFCREVGTQPPRMWMVEPATAPDPARRAGRHWRRLGWSLGLAGAAVAAGIAVALVLPALLQPPGGNGVDPGSIAILPTPRANALDSAGDDPPSNGDVRLASEDVARNVEHALSWNTVDRGTVYLGGEIPLRSFVRQAEETVRWYDPKRQAHVEMTVPRDEVMLVGFQSQ